MYSKPTIIRQDSRTFQTRDEKIPARDRQYQRTTRILGMESRRKCLKELKKKSRILEYSTDSLINGISGVPEGGIISDSTTAEELSRVLVM